MFLCRFIYKIKRTWKMESKNKNGDYVIPDSVKNYDGEPLYILVSLWCKLQEKWISRNDIAEAFGINLRRASFIITYISRRKKKFHFVSDMLVMVTCIISALRFSFMMLTSRLFR